MNVYRAVLISGGNPISKIFKTEEQAKNWIDANNNNYSSRSAIQILDRDYHIVDSYWYT